MRANTRLRSEATARNPQVAPTPCAFMHALTLAAIRTSLDGKIRDTAYPISSIISMFRQRRETGEVISASLPRSARADPLAQLQITSVCEYPKNCISAIYNTNVFPLTVKPTSDVRHGDCNILATSARRASHNPRETSRGDSRALGK